MTIDAEPTVVIPSGTTTITLTGTTPEVARMWDRWTLDYADMLRAMEKEQQRNDIKQAALLAGAIFFFAMSLAGVIGAWS